MRIASGLVRVKPNQSPPMLHCCRANPRSAFKLAAGASLYLPTGTRDDYTSDGVVRAVLPSRRRLRRAA
jgi:hypothetical protein